MDNYKYLKVFYNDILVGTLAKTPERVVAFEYDSDWLNKNMTHLADYLEFLTTVCLTVGGDYSLIDYF